MSDVNPEKIRLDKWLWAARFFKTRQLACDAINGGKVHHNDQRTKPGKEVKIGARLRKPRNFTPSQRRAFSTDKKQPRNGAIDAP